MKPVQGPDNVSYLLIATTSAVGNKIDCADRRVSKSTMEEILPSQSDILPYFEISAKESIGIEDVSLHMEFCSHWAIPFNKHTPPVDDV